MRKEDKLLKEQKRELSLNPKLTFLRKRNPFPSLLNHQVRQYQTNPKFDFRCYRKCL